MNSKSLHTLEFDKIIDIIISLASSDLGKAKIKELVPFTNIEDIRVAQRQTSDALSLIWKKSSLSFSGIKDIGPSIKRLELGSILGISELLAISSLLDVAL